MICPHFVGLHPPDCSRGAAYRGYLHRCGRRTGGQSGGGDGGGRAYPESGTEGIDFYGVSRFGCQTRNDGSCGVHFNTVGQIRIACRVVDHTVVSHIIKVDPTHTYRRSRHVAYGQRVHRRTGSDNMHVDVVDEGSRVVGVSDAKAHGYHIAWTAVAAQTNRTANPCAIGDAANRNKGRGVACIVKDTYLETRPAPRRTETDIKGNLKIRQNVNGRQRCQHHRISHTTHTGTIHRQRQLPLRGNNLQDRNVPIRASPASWNEECRIHGTHGIARIGLEILGERQIRV